MESVIANDETNVPERKPVKDAQGRSYATGKRKNAIARVWIKPGKGTITINNRDITDYFHRPVSRMIVTQPFELTNTFGSFDVVATAKGGGQTGQAGAMRHAISKALDLFEPSLHKALRMAGFLTRDSRIVERKKYGRKKARKSFQFSKR
jgi:small subunit ribosomal protein S9